MRKLGWLSSLCIKLALILLPVVSFSQSWGPKNVNIGNSGGYYEYLPVGYNDPANANRKYPVILALHGVGELGNGTSDLNMITGLGIPGYIQQGNFPSSVTVNGVSHSFIVIAPQFRVWPSYQDVEQYLNYIESKYRADASRLYLTGLSMGGGVAWDYAGSSLAAAQRIAALLPVCGASSPNDPAEKYMSSANLPVLATHNDGDGIVALSNTIGYVDGINNYGPNPRAVKVIFSSGAHNAWTRTYDPNQTLYGGMNAYQWLLQYTRGSSPVAPSPVSVNITSTTHVSCASANNGSATAAASGGAGPYTYSWNTSPVQTSTTASNLAAGNYTVTAKDANGNTATASVTINQPAPLSFSVVPGTIAAYGGSTSVALSATGGTAPYTYTGPTSNVVAGTYTYKVTDAKGCGDTKTITISQPAAVSGPSANISSKTDVTCNGATNGSATVSASGGTAPYTYSWNSSPVQTGATASNLAAGNYSVTVKDANGNSTTASATIAQPAALVISVAPGAITEYQGKTLVTLSAQGGTAPYTFSGGPTASVTAGTYTYKVTDAKGCTDSKTVTITEPAAPAAPVAPTTPLSVSATGTDLTCNGANNGSAAAVASGGDGSFSYSWNTSPVQTTATASNLAAGTYTVTVKDGKGTTATKTVTIAQPAPLVISVTPGTITENNGKTLVTLSAQGGTAPYTFSGGPTASVTAGTYTYKVTDAKGCTDSKTVTITEPAAPAAPVAPTTPLSVSATGTDLTCNGANNGSAAAVASGGDGSFSYSWNTSPAQTTATASNLAAGTYTVTVKDGKGTTATKTVTIAQPAPLVISVTPGAITEYQGKTLVTLSAQGGTAPYTFSGGPTASVTAGTYTYKVTDAKGCTDSKTVTITEPAAPAAPVAPTTPLSVSATGTDLTCNGANNGSAAAVASGGDGSFSYSWNTSPVQTTATASNLAAGTYTVTVKDGKGTTATKTVTIAQPAPLVISVTPGTITENNGKTLVTLSAQGGTAPYTYSGGPTTAVKAGTYTYTVTDAKGCTDSKTVTITDAASATAPVAPTTPLSVSVTSTDIACNGAGDGSATAVVSGGVGSFSYSWNTNPVQTEATASNLAAGNYTVTVKDGNGTTATKTVTITEPAKLSLLASPGVITEYQGKTLVALNAQGGTAPYTYSGGPTTAVRAGTYTYTVTDANGCTDSKTITLTEPSATAGPAVPLSVSVTSTNIACNGANNGSATAVASGGVGSITYSWNTSPVQNNATASGLRAGTYTVTVKDANGTIVIKTVTVTEPAKLTILVSPGVITEYQGKTLVSLNAQGGTAPYTYSGGPTYAVRAGTYTYTVTDAKGCTDSKTITLTEPGATAGPAAPLSVTATSTNITCNGANNGTASAVTSGGAGSVTYNWNTIPVQSSASISGLRAGTYTVTVKDANGATATKTVTIAEPTKLTILVSPGVITEYQGKTLVSVNAQGGTAPYTYSGGPTYAVRAGTYTYTVTDAKGCTASKTITLTEPGATVSNSRSADPGVTLSAYSIQMVDTSAAIQWSTSYENAIDHFEIERTTDNSNYNLVGRVTSLWGSQKSGKYTIYDAKPLSKKNSYRISAIATNGKKIVLQQKDAYYVDKSKISIKNMTNSLDITVENPFMEELTVMIHDLNGKPLGMKTFQKQSFTWNTKWDMQSLRPGTYVLSISGQNVKYAKQVMKL